MAIIDEELRRRARFQEEMKLEMEEESDESSYYEDEESGNSFQSLSSGYSGPRQGSITKSVKRLRSGGEEFVVGSLSHQELGI